MTQPGAGGNLPRLHIGVREENVPLVGEALETADELLRVLPGATTYEDVVYSGLALMKAALGKQIELREPGSRTVQVVNLWG